MIGGLTNPHISLAHGANSRRIFLPCPPKGDTTQCKDGWQSGLMRTPGKRVYPKGTGGSNPPPSAVTAIQWMIATYNKLLSSNSRK
jgi:hypothetical protein